MLLKREEGRRMIKDKVGLRDSKEREREKRGKYREMGENKNSGEETLSRLLASPVRA